MVMKYFLKNLPIISERSNKTEQQARWLSEEEDTVKHKR